MVSLFGGSLSLLNPVGIYAFLALIPFIILYLRQPKILTKTIPSLMFLVKEAGHDKRYRWFKRIFSNLLFVMQLLLLCMLAYAVASPLLTTPDISVTKNTVIIVDVSASMQAQDNDQSRLEKAKGIAMQEVKGATTVITAGNSISLLSNDASDSNAKTAIRAIAAEDAPTNLEAAMHAAAQVLDGRKARIVVISDFINVKGNADDIFKAKRILTSQGNQVDFIPVHDSAENVGIIDATLDREKIELFVRNYGAAPAKVTLQQILGTQSISERALSIGASSTEKVTFPLQEGKSRIVMTPEDDFAVDNVFYTASPDKKKVNVVLITSKRDTYLEKALRADSLLEVSTLGPPFTIESVKSKNPEVIIVSDVNKKELLPGDFDGIQSMVGNKTALVLAAQKDMMEIDYSQLLPMTLGELAGSTKVNINIINQFTHDSEFSVYGKHFTGTAYNGTLIIASADDESPLLTFTELNNGKIIWYGLLDDESDFKTTPGYPIFWHSLVTFLVETENVNDFNKRIEDVPQATKTGYMEEGSLGTALNLLSEQESDVGQDIKAFEEQERRFIVEPQNVKSKMDLQMPLIIAALTLLVVEIVYIKWRGDM